MRRSRHWIAAVVALSVLAIGCTDHSLHRLEPRLAKEELEERPAAINRDIDILFVIDNSGSMAEEQASLVANFQRFVKVLETIEGGLPNVHIGVVSTDLGAGPYGLQRCSEHGDGGRLHSLPRRPECTGPTDPFIKSIADGQGGRITNFDGTLAETFGCIAELGTLGCGFEQPLEAMRRALTHPANAGFLRADAFLQVVFITDEDDCSAADAALFDPDAAELGPLSSFRCFEYGVTCDPDAPRIPGQRHDCAPRDDSAYLHRVRDYVDFLEGLKEYPNMVAVAGIIGAASPVSVAADADGNPTLEPSCVSSVGAASPGVRLHAFVESFPQRNVVTTICNDDLSEALRIVANLMAKILIGPPCLSGDIDLDPDTPGLQYECAVYEVRHHGEPHRTETVIPHCDATNDTPTCWRLLEDRLACPDTPGLYVDIERDGASVPLGTHVVSRCAVR